MGNRNWKPWVHLGNPREELERLMETPAAPGGDGAYVWTPSADVLEAAGELVFRIELPGVPLDAVLVEIEDRVLHIRGERPFPGGDVIYHALELTYGPFARSFTLPSDADRDSVAAVLKDGLLTLTVRRRSERPRRIEPD